jgi:tetratricopeptide (TPR) repeat protein
MKNPILCGEAAWVCVLLLAAGCTSKSPWERDGGQATSLAGFFGQDPASLASTPARAGVTRPSQTVTPSGLPAASPMLAGSQSVTGAFKSAGERVASALEVKPKVIPAADPAKLSSRPEHLTPALYVRAAQLSEAQGAIPTARQQYERALEMAPRDVNSLVAFARFQDRHDRPDEALRLYQQARAVAPTNTIVLNDLGLFHARRGNLTESLEILKQAVRLDPRNVRYRNNLAAALIESRRVTEAIDVLRGVHPEATALFNAACLLSMQNQTQQASALLEQSLRINPSLVAAQDMLRQLQGPAPSPAAPAVLPSTADGPAWSTARRETAQLWESRPTNSASDPLTTSGLLPRKLPPVE